MLANPWVWIAAIIVVGLIVCLALWLGRGADVAIGAGGLRLRTPQPPPQDSIRVAQGADIAGEVGAVTGRVGTGDSPASRASEIDVASGVVVRPGAKVGDITGERVEAGRAAEKTKNR